MGEYFCIFFFSCRVVTYREDRGGSYIEDDGVISGGLLKGYSSEARNKASELGENRADK